MKSPLRVGASAASKHKIPIEPARPDPGKARRVARLSAAAAMVLGVGAASAIFVDYLADRALARAAEAPVVVKPMVAEAVETSAETKVAALAPQPAAEPAPVPATAASQPVEPPRAEIAAATPDPAAIARVAVGPEHAIELPTDDPTASPVVLADEVAASEDAFLVDHDVAAAQRLAAYAEEDLGDDADVTQTAAIAPDAAEPEAQPVKKPKRRPAEAVKPQSIDKKTEVASLPGVNVGGLASSDEDNAGSTVRTVTKKNLGGVAAGAARVSAAVNMRSSPKKGSGVLMVVPAGSAVKVLSCDGWCQIAYNGKTGWVYKSYLTGSKAQPPKQQAAKPAAETTEAPAAPPARKVLSSRL